jgi:hypothetical protein
MTIERVAGWTLLGIHGLTGAIFLTAVAVGVAAMPAEYRHLIPLVVPVLAILAGAWAFCLPAVLRVSRELMAVGQAAPVVAATPAVPKATTPAAAVPTRTPERAAQLPVRRLEA